MEPTRLRERPIHMGSRLKAGVVVLGCLLALAGCGSASSSSSSSSSTGGSGSGEKSSAAGSCAGDSASFAQARTVGSVDVDGDGTPDVVKLTTGSQECPARLIARTAGGYLGGELPADDPSTPKVFGVKLAGRDGDLLVTRRDHPRGGYQLHVFAKGADGLAELKNGDQPLVPFVATDTRPISYTVDCQGASIVVRQAVAKSGGTWDLSSTTYVVDGSTARRTGSKVDPSRLSPEQVDRLMPVSAAVFPSCRA